MDLPLLVGADYCQVCAHTRRLRGLENPARVTAIHSARYANATRGEKAVQSNPATQLAARLPKLCSAASNPKAEPRYSSIASEATAALSAVSTQPIPTPVSTNEAATSGMLPTAKPE